MHASAPPRARCRGCPQLPVVRAAVLAGMFMLMAPAAMAQATPAPPSPGAAAPLPKTSTRANVLPPARGGPSWETLAPAQQTALAPLASIWNGISDAHKRKWLALAQNFSKLSTEEQGRLHSRMVDWASLSPAQRARARLNFAQVPSMSAAQKQAQWEAYQALPPEQKKALAAQAPTLAPGTAPARADAKRKLAPPPVAHGGTQQAPGSTKAVAPKPPPPAQPVSAAEATP